MAVTVVRPGLVEGNADPKEIFLAKYGGMVLNTFNDATIMSGKQTEMSIVSGKSYEFPVAGTATGGYHTPGDEVTGQSVNMGKREITIDGRLLSNTRLIC